MNDFVSFLVVGSSFLSDRLSVSPPVVDGKLAVLLYLVDGFHKHPVSRTIDEFGADWGSFAKGARVKMWSRMDGAPATNKRMRFGKRTLTFT